MGMGQNETTRIWTTGFFSPCFRLPGQTGAPPILVYFSWDWDVHWGYGLLTHGHMTRIPLSPHGGMEGVEDQGCLGAAAVGRGLAQVGGHGGRQRAGRRAHPRLGDGVQSSEAEGRRRLRRQARRFFVGPRAWVCVYVVLVYRRVRPRMYIDYAQYLYPCIWDGCIRACDMCLGPVRKLCGSSRVQGVLSLGSRLAAARLHATPPFETRAASPEVCAGALAGQGHAKRGERGGSWAQEASWSGVPRCPLCFLCFFFNITFWAKGEHPLGVMW